jgi:hypothetical protein
MADPVRIDENSPEAVAYKLLRDIAAWKGGSSKDTQERVVRRLTADGFSIPIVSASEPCRKPTRPPADGDPPADNPAAIHRLGLPPVHHEPDNRVQHGLRLVHPDGMTAFFKYS